MKKGDVVRVSERIIGIAQYRSSFTVGQEAIIAGPAENGRGYCVSICASTCTADIMRELVDLVHPVETLGAYEFYRDCGWLPFSRESVLAEYTVDLFPVGSRVQINFPDYGDDAWMGINGTVLSLEEGGQQYGRDAIPIRTDVIVTHHPGITNWENANLSLLSAEPVVIAPENWQVGDLVRRNPGCECNATNAPSLLDTPIAITQIIGTSIEVSNIQTGLVIGTGGGWSKHKFSFFSRPTTTAQPTVVSDDLPATEWLPGDMLVRVGGYSYHGECPIDGVVKFSRRYGNNFDWSRSPHQLFKTGSGGHHSVEDYKFLYRPSNIQHMPENKQVLKFPIWLDLEGTTENELAQLMLKLESTSMKVWNNGAWANREDAQAQQPNKKIGLCLGYGDNRWLFHAHDNILGTNANLKIQWNLIMASLDHYYPAKNTEKVSKTKVAQRLLLLEYLPPTFIIEREDKPFKFDENVRLQKMREDYGFTGSMGKYTFIQDNKMSCTELSGVADVFQRATNCVRFIMPQDQVLIQTLLTQRKKMVNSSAAQKQKFSIDVAASGPHLMKAFRLFMSTIGYRQENSSKVDGAYILVNGGNMFADQPATWQYAEVPNHRNACFDLTKNWEKMCSRLSNNGVALPVLDADDLDRPFVVGDKVVMLDTSVQEGLPEDLLTLTKHVCGETYIISLAGDQSSILNFGYRISNQRLALIESPKGLQNGDIVKAKENLGELIKAGELLTFFNGKFVRANEQVVMLPKSHYEVVEGQQLVDALLVRDKITLPFVARITTADMENSGDEVVINDAWAINGQQLGFWHEANTERDAWYERGDFSIITKDTVNESEVVIEKADKVEDTIITFNGAKVSVQKLEELLALALVA